MDSMLWRSFWPCATSGSWGKAQVAAQSLVRSATAPGVIWRWQRSKHCSFTIQTWDSPLQQHSGQRSKHCICALDVAAVVGLKSASHELSLSLLTSHGSHLDCCKTVFAAAQCILEVLCLVTRILLSSWQITRLCQPQMLQNNNNSRDLPFELAK